MLAFCALTVLTAVSHQIPAELAFTDAQIHESIAKAARLKKQSSYLVARSVTHIRVQDNGASHRYSRSLLYVAKPKGARELATLLSAYDPSSEHRRYLAVHIRKKNGKIIRSVDVSKQHSIPRHQRRIYWGLRYYQLPIAGLKVGQTLDITSYRTGYSIAYLQQKPPSEFVPPMKGHYYEQILFGSHHHPIVYQNYIVQSPRSKPLFYKIFNKAVFSQQSFDEQYVYYHFWMHDIGKQVREKAGPARSDYYPKVVMSSEADWRRKASWFYRISEQQLKTSPDITKQVRKILEGISPGREQVHALNRWVAHNIHYKGLSIGQGEGYTIHPSSLTYAERSGVCKDKAGLLVTMLRDAGFEAYPVMTMVGARVEDVPADQFNHCVVGWRNEKGAYELIDPTWAPYSRQLWSPAEDGQDYLIGAPDVAALGRTPLRPASTNQLFVDIKTSIKTSGDAQVNIRIQAQGVIETSLRKRIAHSLQAEIPAYFEKLCSAIWPYAHLLSYKHAEPDKLENDFFMEFAASLPGYALVGKNSLSFLPVSSTKLVAALRGAIPHSWYKAKTRKTKLMLRYNRIINVQERLQLPPLYQFVSELPHESMGNAQARLRLSSVAQALNGRSLQRQLMLKQKVIAPKHYVAFRKLMQRYDELNEQRWFAYRPSRNH